MAVLDRLLDPDSPLQHNLFFLARRFVAGETSDDAITVVRELNAAGMSATLDYLGEDVTRREEALVTKDAYLALIERLRETGVNSNLSVKLSALGLIVDEAFALENLTAILDAAKTLSDPFVRIDMEGSPLADATLRVFEQAYKTHQNVGPVLQAYLKRTPCDVDRAIELGARVRLCKGAYQEPPTIAHRDMPTIRREYLRLAEALLTRGNYPGIATHDERIIKAVKAYAGEWEIPKDRYEFQMLYGVRPDLQRAIIAAGHRLRIYVPYGIHWAGYFYRRVTERKENAFFALRSLISR